MPLALALGAAAAPAASQGQAPASAREKKDGLVIGIREYLSDVPAMIADRDGLYAREGVKVRTILSREGKDNGRLLRDRTVDAAILGNHIGLEALAQAPKDDPLVVIACLGGGGGRWRLMASTRSGIGSLEDLRKRRLGAWPRSYGYHLLEEELRKRGIEPELVRVPMEPELAAAALEKGDVDALFAWEPIPTMLEEKKLAREVFTLEGRGEGVPVYLAARRSVVRGEPELIAGLLRALDRATAFVNADPDEAARRVSPLLRLPAPVLAKALRRNAYGLGLTCRQRQSLRDVIRVFRERGLNDVPAGLAIEFDPAPLKAFLRARGPGSAAALEETCPGPAPASVGRLDVGYFLGGRTSILMRVQEEGGFAAEGLEVALLSKTLHGAEFAPLTREQVEKQDYPSKVTGAELLDGLSNGSWDLATIGESSFLSAVAERKPVVAVAKLGYDLSDKSGHLFAVKKGTLLRSPADYRGKLFVSRRAGPGDEAFLLEYLARAGIDLDRDVLVLPKLPATAGEKRALPRDKVLLVYQVYEDELRRGVREGLIDGGFFHLKPFEKMRGELEMVEPLQGWTRAGSSMALLVCRRGFAATPEGRAKLEAFLAAFVKRVRLEKAMTSEQRRAQSSSDEAVDRWRGLQSATPGADYPQYDAVPTVDAAALGAMASLLRKHKLVDWPDLDAAPYIDNTFVEEAVRKLDAAR